jgi:hypothetical protein
MSPEKSNGLQNFLNKDSLNELIINILKLNFPVSEIFPCSPLIFTSPNTKLNALLNDIKEKSLKCYNILFEFLINLREINFSGKKIYLESPEILNLIFKSTLKVLSNGEIQRTVRE